MKGMDFILGYTLPLIPVALAQAVFCYVVGFAFGLKLSLNILWAVLMILPAAIFFIGLGLLFGSILTQKQVGGICGTVLTNLTAWMSGIWFDLDLVGGAFKKIAQLLPFYHAVSLEQAVFAGNWSEIFPSLLWVCIYAVAAVSLAVLLFLRQMKK